MAEPAEITVDYVKQLDPDLTSDMPDATIQALIDNAHLIAVGDRFPKAVTVDGEDLPILAMATRFMTLHLAYINGPAGKGVISEKVDVIERHYADTSSAQISWLRQSLWGQAYLRLYREYGGGQSRYAVIEH